MRKRPDFGCWILQFWKDSKQESSFPGKRSYWRINKKEIVKKMEKFFKYPLFKYRQCKEKVNRVGNKRRSGLRYNNSRIKTGPQV